MPGRYTGPREVLALLRVLRRTGAQALMVDTPRDVRLSAYATLLHRARIVYRYNLNYRRPRTHLMDRVYLSRVAGLVYQSRWIREDALAFAPWLGRKRSWRVPNGYDTALYLPRPDAGAAFRARHGIAADAVVAVTLAKLARHKGQEVAMAATRLRRAAEPSDDLHGTAGGGGRRCRARRGGSRGPSFAAGDLSQRRRRGDGLRSRGRGRGRRRHERADRPRRVRGIAGASR